MSRKFEYIKLSIEERMPAKKVAELAGVHENTVYNWLAAYHTGGFAALAEKSRAPKSHPNEYSDELKDLIRNMRADGVKKEKRYLGEGLIAHRLERDWGINISHSGIGMFMQREGLISTQRKRRPKKDRVQHCRIHEPGELAQMDVKYAVKSHAGYWYFEYDAIDYVTGIVIGDIYEIQSTFESVLFFDTLCKRLPFPLTGLQTDNHSTFTNYYTGYTKSADPSQPRLHALDLACQRRGITHYLIDPGKPAQNGKIERFHRTVEDEFYQTNTFKDLNSLRKKFRDYLHYYNNEREHSAFAYRTPLEQLQTFPQYEKIKAIMKVISGIRNQNRC